ncbi:hypothetical protein MBRA1_001472 [Malassezia brasiliensis]|uniref:Proteasome assembly chaperone 3 n=1 Tax=Malassezia brasiliensis TaxID=1821822 RepID=A0AAF0DRK1_9BASI|nr:hypothetical protein MBRA1_001472 [Malassezia brasiliensis]
MVAPPLSSGVHVEPLAHNVLRTAKRTEVSGGKDITVFCQEYEDRTLVLVTQLEKVGYLVQALVNPGEQTAEFLQSHHRDAMVSPTVTLVPLFGAPPSGLEDLYALYATQIAARICADLYTPESMLGSIKPVVVGLALRRTLTDGEMLDMDAEQAKLATVLSLLAQCRVW